MKMLKNKKWCFFDIIAMESWLYWYALHYNLRSDRELNPGPSYGSPLRNRYATQASLVQ